MNIVCRFRIFPNIVCDDNKTLWHIENCPRKRTIPTRVLTYNKSKKAYRINGNWVTRKRLLNLRYEVSEKKEPKRFQAILENNFLNEF